MADIRAEDLTQETKSTLDGSEQFIMFDSTEGKRGTVSAVGDYILQNGDASGQGDTVADMIADVPTGDTVSFTQTQTSGDELGTITINGTGKKIYGKSYANKQDKLVSGTNIKTINGNSLLGSGNIVIQGGGGGDTVTYTQTVSSGTKLGDININGTPNTVYAPTIPTTVSSFTNDAGYLTSHQSIKTINSTSMVGTGNVSVQPTLVSGTNIKTVNNESLLGSGNITIQGGGLTTFREKGVRNADYGNIQGITITVNASAQYQFIDGFIFSRQGLNSFRINTNASGVPAIELTHINGNDTFQGSVNGQTVSLQATTTWNDFGILYFGSIVESNLTFGAITA